MTIFPGGFGVRCPTMNDSAAVLALIQEEEGTTMAGICLCSCNGSDGIIGTLAVRHPWRRKGLGRALLSQSFAALSRRGMGTIRLFVDLHNSTGAIQIYERAGMQITHLYHQYEKELQSRNTSGSGLAAQ